MGDIVVQRRNTIIENNRLVAFFQDKIGAMGSEHHRTVYTPFEHFLLAFSLEIYVADQDDFIDKIAIKFNGKG